MDISCAFPTTLHTPEHVEIAEDLGYDRAWLYDTPQQSPDVWMTLALAAGRTSRIGLGPGVLVPSLRHPMTNAAATATLAAQAPGRVAVAFGTGFSGRRAMGYPGIKMKYMLDYVRVYKGLLAGETVEWEGARMRMLHPDGSAPARPINVPILFGVHGPRGGAIAEELGDGLLLTGLQPLPAYANEFKWSAYIGGGTVLAEGESTASAHVRAAAGPPWAMAYHSAYEFGGLDAVRELEGGEAWAKVIEVSAPEDRHLAVHDKHCLTLNAADAAAWDAGAHSTVLDWTFSGTRSQLRDKVSAMLEQGISEFVWQPCGEDVRGELERFRDAVEGL